MMEPALLFERDLPVILFAQSQYSRIWLSANFSAPTRMKFDHDLRMESRLVALAVRRAVSYRSHSRPRSGPSNSTHPSCRLRLWLIARRARPLSLYEDWLLRLVLRRGFTPAS